MDTTKVFPKPDQQTAGRVIDDEAVLILANTSEINVLNAVGSRIFELSDGTHTVADIINIIVAEFDVTHAQAKEDTIAFLRELAAQNVMVLDEPTE